jgi:hypothetical protein
VVYTGMCLPAFQRGVSTLALDMGECVYCLQFTLSTARAWAVSMCYTRDTELHLHVSIWRDRRIHDCTLF